jgi:hypothetical protein
MACRLYSASLRSGDVAPLDKQRMLHRGFDTLDVAMGWARHLDAGGRVALLVERRRRGKREIPAALQCALNASLGNKSGKSVLPAAVPA